MAPDPHPTFPICAGCGTCCRLVVELRPDDNVPEDLVAVNEGLRCMDQHGDGTCVALDRKTKLCTIYEQRPAVCRLFERGTGLCRNALVRFGYPTREQAPQLYPPLARLDAGL
jgi:Fe-S-cluster containining protein